MYFLKPKKFEEPEALASLQKNVRVLAVYLASFAYADCRAVRWVVDRNAVWDMSMRQRSVLDNYSPCIEGTIVNTPMPSRTHGGARSAAMMHNDGTVMNGSR